MRENVDLTKYLYQDGIENIEKLEKMRSCERKEYIEKMAIINTKKVFMDKEDEMLSLINVGTIRDNEGNILRYIDLNTGEGIKIIEESKLSEVRMIPYFRRYLTLLMDKYYKKYNNIVFNHEKNYVSFDCLKCNNGNYFSYYIEFPLNGYMNIYDNDYYKYERRYTNVFAQDKNIDDDENGYSASAYLTYHKLDAFYGEENGCCKIFNIECQKKKILCKYLDGAYIIDIDGNVKFFSSHLEAQLCIRKELIDNKFVTEENIDEVMEPFFKMINTYIETDFKNEKTKELRFINGLSSQKKY